MVFIFFGGTFCSIRPVRRHVSVIQNETEIVINNLLQTTFEITIIDAMGKLVFVKKINNTYFNIDTAIFAKGVYHLRCVANGKVFDRKIALR